MLAGPLLAIQLFNDPNSRDTTILRDRGKTQKSCHFGKWLRFAKWRDESSRKESSAARNRRILSGWLLTSMLILSFCSLPEAAAQARDHAAQKLKVVVFGGHPDDPESGAGGLIKILTGLGHEVIVAYG